MTENTCALCGKIATRDLHGISACEGCAEDVQQAVSDLNESEELAND